MTGKLTGYLEGKNGRKWKEMSENERRQFSQRIASYQSDRWLEKGQSDRWLEKDYEMSKVPIGEEMFARYN